MKRVLSVAATLSLLVAASPAGALDLIISEYVEGSSNNKAVELYNPTCETIDLSAGLYRIDMYFNGSTTAGTPVLLTGTVLPNATFVVAHTSATFAASANQTSGAVQFNGDDAVVLRKGGSGGPIVDSLGQVGLDPGTEWGTGLASTADNTLRRKGDVCAGDTVADDAFVPATQWDGFATDTFGGLGAHSSTCYDCPPPVGVEATTWTGAKRLFE
jgi:predicted extracellular nuclease